MAELRRCDFDFDPLSNELGARDAELPASDWWPACALR